MDKVWFLAINKNDSKLLEALLEVNGVDIDSYNSDGQTALYVVSKNGNLDLIKFLIRRLANVNKYTLNMKSSCLQIAALCGHLEIVEYLLKMNIDVNHVNDKGYTALHGAVSSGHTNIARVLLQNGADVFIKDIDGATALYWALNSNNKDCVELIQSAIDQQNKPKQDYNQVVKELNNIFHQKSEQKSEQKLALEKVVESLGQQAYNRYAAKKLADEAVAYVQLKAAQKDVTRALASDAAVASLLRNNNKSLAKMIAEEAVAFISSNKLKSLDNVKLNLTENKLVITVTDFDSFKKIMDLISKNI